MTVLSEIDWARDYAGYGQHPPNPHWPNNARVAINFNLNYEGGGEAKVRIANGEVMLNGLVETRKRKKVYHDDEVEYLGQVLKVKVGK